MNGAELIAHCRSRRQGKPPGDVHSPAVLAEVLTMVLDDRLLELASREREPSGGVYDSLNGRIVPSRPGVPAPDPKGDHLACSLATLIGYVEDLRKSG